MIDWLKEVLVLEKVYWYLAVPFTVLLLLQIVLTFIGLGGDSDVDGDADVQAGDEPGTGFRLFTVRNFITFFAVFGWSGITFSRSGLNTAATIIISVVIAIIVLLIVSALFYFITRLTSSGTMNINSAIGLTGEVYLPIPAKRNGTGKITITFHGNYREMLAVTDGDKKLARGTIVRVMEVVGANLLLVEKINKGAE